MTIINNGYTHFPMDFAYAHSNIDDKENVSKTSKDTLQKSSNDPYDLDLTILNHSSQIAIQMTHSDTCGGTYRCVSEACQTGTCTGTYGC